MARKVHQPPSGGLTAEIVARARERAARPTPPKSTTLPKSMHKTLVKGLMADYRELARAGEKGSARRMLSAMRQSSEAAVRRAAYRQISANVARSAVSGIAGKAGGAVAALTIGATPLNVGEDEWARRRRLEYAQQRVRELRKAKASR